ncbi:Vegetative incompatibility HET-E-1 [Fusarium agapanthi]|uniref:Vegetative incompatibility HET-E-1 n=1 Tax=Fusarium agapanthi TaxID=1803897 RepID=A0A9P5EET5_9HYPO|nr:Vegetative incompatibility HET-E-1 [Fusarium agapanthi]
MRLINVETLELESFTGEHGGSIPTYAILSHVWTSEEVSLQQISGLSPLPEESKGYRKIVDFCAKAKAEGFEYGWIDTCCIDKTSSAELSEAINSMFQWYRKSAACYVYMNDVSSAKNPRLSNSRFRKSRWFTRGWTLQELLAPHEVIFLADDWREIGTKASLSATISDITKIDVATLVKQTWSHVSVAGIMSWASMRQTTRLEDQAYSLMGLFDVNMPLIYGEGPKAFYRLQV